MRRRGTMQRYGNGQHSAHGGRPPTLSPQLRNSAATDLSIDRRKRGNGSSGHAASKRQRRQQDHDLVPADEDEAGLGDAPYQELTDQEKRDRR
jgi:hypothetical protein